MSALACGCNATGYDPKRPEEEGPSAPKVVQVEKAEATFDTEVNELSSMCFNAAHDGFYAVSDGGKVYELNLDGTTRSVLFNEEGYDWEGIDWDGSTIWLEEETESALYTLKDGTLTKVVDIEIPEGGASGKGPEGMMCKGDTIYVANQAQPTRIVKYCKTSGTVSGAFDITFNKKFLSDLCYDATDDTMWIVDSKGPAFYHCTLDGKLLATYEMPLTFIVQAEALVIDREAGIAWVGCDVKSKIYKIKL